MQLQGTLESLGSTQPAGGVVALPDQVQWLPPLSDFAGGHWLLQSP